MSTDFKEGDWVRVTRFPRGYTGFRAEAYIGKVIHVGRVAGNVDVRIYDEHKAVLTSFSVASYWLKPVPAPDWKTALSGIPNTAEVQQFKDIIWATAMRYKKSHSLCGVLEKALEEAGVEKPLTPRAKIKVAFEVEVDIDRLVSAFPVTEANFGEIFGTWPARDQFRAALAHLDYNSVKLNYKLLPAPLPEVVTPDREESK